jgi:putative membrane protein
MLKTKLMKTLLSATILAAFAAPMAASAQAPAAGMNTPAASALNKADQKIVMDMARANMAEVEAGKMAVSKSQNAEVKAYAQRMIDDHTKALNDVTTLAQTKGVTLPTEVDAKHKAMAAKLGKLEGEAFDREYMKQAGVSDHTKVHAMLKKESARAKDPDVKALAMKMMPTVEEHLTTAKGMPMTSTKGGGKSMPKGTKPPVTGEPNDHTSPGAAKPPAAAKDTTGMTSGTSGTMGATGTKPPVTGEPNDHTSPGAVKPPPAAKDTTTPATTR